MCEVLKDEELYENNGEIMVSVYFPTYNHSKYIEKSYKLQLCFCHIFI